MCQHAVFQKEGDMTFILGRNPFIDGGKEHNKRERKNAVVDPTNLWPGATIPYEISSVFNGMYILHNVS